MEAVHWVPPHVWLAVHVIGIILAISSRTHLGPTCAFCTNCLMAVVMALVGVVAVWGFLSQQPFWAASGTTLGMMAVVTCFERQSYEPDRVLQAFASSDEQPVG